MHHLGTLFGIHNSDICTCADKYRPVVAKYPHVGFLSIWVLDTCQADIVVVVELPLERQELIHDLADNLSIGIIILEFDIRKIVFPDYTRKSDAQTLCGVLHKMLDVEHAHEEDYVKVMAVKTELSLIDIMVEIDCTIRIQFL